MALIADYRLCAAEGLTRAETAERLGVQLNHVTRVARLHGIEFQGSAPRTLITAAVLRQVLQMRAAGAAWRAISTKFGFSPVSLQQAVARSKRAPAGLPRSDDAHPPAGDHAAGVVAPNPEDDEDDVPEFVAPCPRQVQSLMARGFSRAEAIRQSVIYRKAQARKAESVAALPAVVRRVPSKQFRVDQLHAPNMEQPSCKRLGAITTRSDQIAPKSCGVSR